MKSIFNRIVVLALLISILGLALFSVLVMSHGSSGMMGTCPLSLVNGSVQCLDGGIEAVRHHLSAFQSLFSSPINFDFMTRAISLLFVALFFVFYRSLSLQDYSRSSSRKEYNPNILRRSFKVTRWLSFLENSPPHPKNSLFITVR